jgi:hypothetical protein
LGGGDDATSDFAAVGNQDFGEHRILGFDKLMSANTHSCLGFLGVVMT